MGFLDRLLGRKPSDLAPVPEMWSPTRDSSAQSLAPTPNQPPLPSMPSAGVATARGAHNLSRTVAWYPNGVQVNVHGLNLPGLVYVGRGLASPKLTPDPSLIDPSLRVDPHRPDTTGRSLDYWPSYAKLTPGARAAYLEWLSSGRSDPHAPIGYVFIYFYGLERRALVDIAADKSLTGDVPAIRNEVQRLLGIYGDNGSFGGYASQFLPVLDLLEATSLDPVTATPPPLVRQTWPAPMTLRIALGDLAADDKPIPANWALAWAWYHPEIYARTPANRCATEFAELFLLRYENRYGAGLKVRDTGRPVKVNYYTASAGIGNAELEMTGIPDVFESPAAGRALRDIFDKVTDELDPYSRWLGRNPDPTPRQALAGAALLPGDLATSNREVADFRSWLEQALSGREQAVIDGTEILARWPVTNPEKMAKSETTALAALMAQFDVGVEPDVRFGGPPITPSPVVLFRTGPASPASATPMYSAATTLLHLAAVVAAADGAVSLVEQTHLVEHLDAALHLTEGERTRLSAHLTWLLNNDLKTTGLKKRLDALTNAQREGIGQLLVTVAAADGVISPEEVTTLSKVYALLGLDPSSVTSRLHVSMTEPSRPATAPVRVREATTEPPGFGVPPPGRHRAPEGRGAGLVLDEDVIAAKLEQTAEVTALLRTLFTEEDAAAWVPSAPTAADGPSAASTSSASPDGESAVRLDEAIAGLDTATSALLRRLSERSTWSRAEFEELAASFGVMPDGAIDMLNEASIDATGEPVIEGDDDLDINPEGLEGLLR